MREVDEGCNDEGEKLEEMQLDTITTFRRTKDAIDELFQHT